MTAEERYAVLEEIAKLADEAIEEWRQTEKGMQHIQGIEHCQGAVSGLWSFAFKLRAMIPGTHEHDVMQEQERTMNERTTN